MPLNDLCNLWTTAKDFINKPGISYHLFLSIKYRLCTSRVPWTQSSLYTKLIHSKSKKKIDKSKKKSSILKLKFSLHYLRSIANTSIGLLRNFSKDLLCFDGKSIDFPKELSIYKLCYYTCFCGTNYLFSWQIKAVIGISLILIPLSLLGGIRLKETGTDLLITCIVQHTEMGMPSWIPRFQYWYMIVWRRIVIWTTPGIG